MSSNGPTASIGQGSVAVAMQKEADEHLFLRYLELDPPEDPAAPKRTQRNGRTPFTTTRKWVPIPLLFLEIYMHIIYT